MPATDNEPDLAASRRQAVRLLERHGKRHVKAWKAPVGAERLADEYMLTGCAMVVAKKLGVRKATVLAWLWDLGIKPIRRHLGVHHSVHRRKKSEESCAERLDGQGCESVASVS